MKTITKVAALAAVLALAAVTQGMAQRPTFKREIPPQLLRRTKVTEDSALKVATARIPRGTPQALELENENGHLIWSFDFAVPNLPGIYEVNIDALTGAIVGKVEHELPTPSADTAHRAAPKPRP